MRAVDTAVTLADRLGKQLIVFWGRDIHLNCKFSDLFNPSECFTVIEEKQYMGRKAPFPYLPGSKPNTPLRSTLYDLTKVALNIKSEIWFEEFEAAILPLVSDINPRKIRSMKEFEKMSFSYIEPLLAPLQVEGNSFISTAWSLLPEHNYSKRFVPTDTLQSQIISVTSKFTDTIGVHIRRSDHKAAIQYSSLKKFINAMDCRLKENSNTTFFLATDCIHTERELLNRFPDIILTYTKSSYCRNSKTGVQDALIDLYCLSKTNKILGSYYSSFSQVAAEISGIEEVTI